jgi:hypothetical protein
MGIQRCNFRSWDEEKKHRAKRIEKLEKIQGLEALMQTWEPLAIESAKNHQYLLDIRRRLRCAQNQLAAMKQ